MANAKQDQKSGDNSLFTHVFLSLSEVKADCRFMPNFR
ncbi:hypothetical protein AM1_4798 [Acaryochloris marina MBIC11017]|uniref:Uncharacterized protein n=1 Tax=Acaryochloris marina (strain MBIC 11017) TaxID=329726 RepID=B0C2H9_ACAM1|nr:hypothetical protein AM1_4798 [Acaryochloris marina MBIC11017]